MQFRIAGGDESALRELYECWSGQLFQLAMTIIRSRPLAEEIVEDVFLRIWQQRSRLEQIENLKSYSYILTRNISIDYLRKTSGKRIYNLDEVQLPPLLVEATPEELMISAELLKKINLAINDLPPKCRLIFKLVKMDGLKYRDVALLLNLQLKTVETQMSIALKRLHNAILFQLPAASRQ
ncbi:RNA polymerase sigma-70 factor [Compostibacter hankyongensis]|uniref:RNA polymerase sigma-70 factor n=1 Tax=Compostibacter hankyongensis TaxID=1007089 RepID=UPI0031EBA0AE